MAGGSLDGVVAKRHDLPYQPGAGRGMLKNQAAAHALLPATMPIRRHYSPDTSITGKYRLARRVQTRLVKPASIAGVLNSAVTTDRFPGFEGFLGLEV